MSELPMTEKLHELWAQQDGYVAEIARLRERIEKLEAGRQTDYAAGVDSGARQVIEQLSARLRLGLRFDLLAQLILDAQNNPFTFSLNRNMPALGEVEREG